MNNNMKSIAIDNGYGYTKAYPGDVIFKSTVKSGMDIYNEDVIQIEFNNSNYIIGENNNCYIADQDKLSSEVDRKHLILTTITAIGLNFKTEKDITVNICLGTPSQYFEQQRSGMVELFKNNDFKIKINKVGHEQTIKINKILVLPQALAPILTNEEYLSSRVTVIDIGSGTIDVAEVIKGKLSKTLTIEKGCMKLYSKISQKINNEFATKYTPDDIIDLINDNEFIVKGESRNTSTYIAGILEEYVGDFINDIKQADFDLLGTKVSLIGGGALLLNKNIKELVNHARIEFSPQKANVESFYKILLSKLG